MEPVQPGGLRPAILLLVSFTCKRDWVVQQVPYGPRPKTLPVFSPETKSLDDRMAFHNIKHKTVLLTLYSAGLKSPKDST